MDPLLLSFLSKVPPLPKGAVIRRTGIAVESSMQKVRQYYPGLNPNDVKALGILLQYSEPSLYTHQELTAVLSLRLDLLDNNLNELLPPLLTPMSGITDTGSGRVQRQLVSAGLDLLRLAFIEAKATAFTPTNIVLSAVPAAQSNDLFGRKYNDLKGVV
jgi:hypothetical protein